MQSNGGAAAPDAAGNLACAALLSGPAAGVAAASRLGSACGHPNVIGVDMGGTSYDVALIRDATPRTRSASWFSRWHIGLPMLDIHTIGAGGGSLAWVDAGGALRVGPESAGARPGPACYGLGGTAAAVTDAFLHLGYINPDFFLGGRIKLDPAAARAAIERAVAKPLGMTVDEAAFSIFRIVNNNMSNGIRYVSVAQGHDPRDFALMAFGGAGSVTAGVQARDLGIGKILVPRMAAVLCAAGELWADLRLTQLLSTAGPIDRLDAEAIGRALDALAAPARARLAALPGIADVAIERHAEMRYAGQVHELATPMPLPNGRGMAGTLAATAAAFHDLHHQLYAFAMREKPLEMIAVRQDVVGRRAVAVPVAAASAAGPAAAAIKARRPVCFPSGTGFAWREAPIYDGAKLAPGHAIQGPAVIEEVDTTIVLYPGDRARLNGYNAFEVDVGE
jgi:N-methylhydantoinase A